MYFRVLLSIVFITLLSTSFASFALGKVGHQLVCQLSYDLLTSPQQQSIDALLKTVSPATKKLINRYNHQKENEAITFAKACTWADAIKRDHTFDRYKSWHYVNVDRNQNRLDASSCQKDCLTSAIIYHAKHFTESETPEDKLQALMFLGHWLGDIHQPLHVSFSSDLGGNKVAIIPKYGKCKNLHWYWDQCLLYVEKLPKDVTAFEFLYPQLTTQMTSVTTPIWHEADVYSWANESIALVTSEGFGYCKKTNDKCLPLTSKKTEITLAYHQKYQAILEHRIVLAAHRLTSILNEVL
ncbi:S1/P1 nuclease [Thalassotalea piscium]